jgi:ApeA N-terminal domain 1
MKPFEGEGVFWLPSDDETQLAGKIVFDPIKGTTLSLFGAFDSLRGQSSQDSQALRLHGVAGKRYLTLEGCFITDTTHEVPGISRQTFHVSAIMTNHLFDEGEALTFDEVSVTFDQLPYWIGRSGVAVDYTLKHDEQSADEADIDFRKPEDEIVQLDDLELCLQSSWGLRGDHITNTQLIQGTYLTLKYRMSRTLKAILDDLKALQDLLTLAIDAPVVPEEVTFRRKDLTHEVGSVAGRPKSMSYYAPQLAERLRLDRPQSPGHILFRYQDIGGLPTIARWLVVARNYDIVLGWLLSIRYASGLYVQNRFLNVVSAAESFHRLRFSNELMPEPDFQAFIDKLIERVPGEHREWLSRQLQFSNEPRLRRRLRELARYAGPAFTSVCGKRDRWITLAVEVRNRLTHYDKDRRLVFEEGDLYFLAESVYVLVMLCLFRECGVAADVLSSVREGMNMQFLRQRLVGVVPRLSAQVVRR